MESFIQFDNLSYEAFVARPKCKILLNSKYIFFSVREGWGGEGEGKIGTSQNFPV